MVENFDKEDFCGTSVNGNLQKIHFEDNTIYFLGSGDFKLDDKLTIKNENVILVGASNLTGQVDEDKKLKFADGDKKLNLKTTITKKSDRDGVYVTGKNFGMLSIKIDEEEVETDKKNDGCCLVVKSNKATKIVRKFGSST